MIGILSAIVGTGAAISSSVKRNAYKARDKEWRDHQKIVNAEYDKFNKMYYDEDIYNKARRDIFLLDKVIDKLCDFKTFSGFSKKEILDVINKSNIDIREVVEPIYLYDNFRKITYFMQMGHHINSLFYECYHVDNYKSEAGMCKSLINEVPIYINNRFIENKEPYRLVRVKYSSLVNGLETIREPDLLMPSDPRNIDINNCGYYMWDIFWKDAIIVSNRSYQNYKSIVLDN